MSTVKFIWFTVHHVLYKFVLKEQDKKFADRMFYSVRSDGITSSLFNIVAASPYAGFIALQWPHPVKRKVTVVFVFFVFYITSKMVQLH